MLLLRYTSTVITYLVHCLSNSASNDESFNDLRYSMYHQKKKKSRWNVEKLPCTSSSIQYHILRSYFQCFHWLHAAFQHKILLNTKDFGYDLNEEEYLVHSSFPLIIFYQQTILLHVIVSSVPVKMFACNCLKCSRKNVKVRGNVVIHIILKKC